MMRKLVLSLFLIVLTLKLSAQVDQKYRIALLFNPQISWLKTDNANANSGSGVFGYNFGLSIDRFFSPNYAINTGLTINTTGGSLNYNSDITMMINGDEVNRGKVTYHAKYIEVPLALKLRTNDFGRVAYYGVFGLSAQVRIKTNDGDGNTINDHVRFINTAYHFGGGIEYSLGGTTYLVTGMQFHNGLTDITKHSDFKDQSILNRLVFNMGVVF
jgi:hypothetical protein